MISHLARSISPSPTFELNEIARVLREKGDPVINMGIGEPKNKTPITAILSSSAKITSGDVKYTPPDGTPALKKAIIRYMEENYDKRVSPENIIVSAGAKQSIYNILFSITNPQDEIVVLAPYWVSYTEMIKMVHGLPVVVTPEDGTFHPRMEDIEKVITSYTKAIIVNSPNNPSGIVFSDSFIEEIVEFCEDNKIYLIFDDIYHKLIFDSLRPTSVFQFTKKDIESSMIIIVNGVSKLYGMTGFRIGWVVASRKLVEIMINIQAQTTSCTSAVLQAAAEGALTGMQSVVESLRLMVENNRNIIMQELKSFNGIRVTKPQGTFYCLPDFRNYIPSALAKNSIELSKFILDKALVVTIPGKEFGMEGYLRLSYAGSAKEIKEGIERVKWAIDPNAPNEIYIGDRKLVRDWL